MIDAIAQIMITLFGGAAIWLIGSQSRDVRRWGFICGLFSQPWWVVTLVINQQWLMLPICVLYTWGWLSGIFKNWHEGFYW